MNIEGLIIPEGYKSKYSLIETEVHIKKSKIFSKRL
ncbi:aspartate--ammonia ligase [Clostridium butyricum]|nr:aspartate--ammonia ligase [Clostridium butyricum]MBA8972054.1 aspartate--ammonia ligase [Clostridium butyricum]NOW36081.1 aspartate--ammonia ligase [Clostridium butyricum]